MRTVTDGETQRKGTRGAPPANAAAENAAKSRPRGGSAEPDAEQDYSDADIRALVKGLDSLQGGKLAAAALIGCGARAIPALREFLLKGRPRGVFQPRQLAVKTLAELGAKDVLMEYLLQPKTFADPVVRFGEDAVISTAARALAKWPSDETFEFLCHLATDRVLFGVVEGLAQFKRADAAPYLLKALGDDICRRGAEAGLEQLGVQIQPWLVAAANHPEPSPEDETPSSRIRRRTALRILAGQELSRGDWWQLRQLLFDSDPEVSLRASQIAFQIGSPEDQQIAVQQMIQALPRVNWFVRNEVRDCLVKHFADVGPLIRNEVARRAVGATCNGPADIIASLLLSVVREADQGLKKDG